ncbi:unnamed protein product, partial [Prorocentrum cordatum]
AVQEARGSRPLLAALTLLETLAIRSNTEDWRTYEELDAVLSNYFSDHFLMGTACNIGQTVSVPPRASRASAAWKRRAPGKTRLPLPRSAVHAIAGWPISHGQLGLACWAALAFAAYLRPAEAQSLTRECPVPPAPAAGPGCTCKALLMHPLERGVAGETGHCDDSVAIDQAPLWPILDALSLATTPGASPWSFPLEAITLQVRAARRALQLSSPRPHLYSLRRGGASDDLLTGRRSPTEVQRRGRWAVASPMRRCGKEGSPLGEMARISAEVFAFGALVETNFGPLLEHGFSGLNLCGHVPAAVMPALGPTPIASGRRVQQRRPPLSKAATGAAHGPLREPGPEVGTAEGGHCSRHLKRRLKQ